MIGWRPYLLTLGACVALAVCAVDVSAGFGPSHVAGGTGVCHALHQGVHDVDAWVDASACGLARGRLAVFLLAWGWVRATAFARLGTIQIADLTCDDNALARSPLRRRSSTNSASAVSCPQRRPRGSPSVASITDAISKAPIPQAGLLGAAIGLIPWPPSSTGFNVSGSLMRVGPGARARVQLAYEVVCTGPEQSVKLGVAAGAGAQEAIKNAGPDLYRLISESAPSIYPDWARWSSTRALMAYREGLDLEQTSDGYRKAHARYLEASEEDPDNMLARLRAANCLERIATGAKTRAETRELQGRALAAYLSIRIRRPDIFEAGFRASVLMSVLASESNRNLSANVRLEETLRRFERATSRYIDPRELPDSLSGPRVSGTMAERLEAAALEEARRARHQLRLWRTLVHEKRLRHRFEPTGRERRQLRKALGISKMAQRARREQRLALERLRARAKAAPGQRRRITEKVLSTASPHLLSEIRQWWWQMLVKWHYCLSLARRGMAGPLQRRVLLRSPAASDPTAAGTPPPARAQASRIRPGSG